MKFNIVNERETEPTNVFLEADYELNCGITAEVTSPAWGIASRHYYKVTDLPAEINAVNFDVTAGDVRIVHFSDASERSYISVVSSKSTYTITEVVTSGGIPFALPEVSTSMLVPAVAVLGLGVAAYYLYNERGSIL